MKIIAFLTALFLPGTFVAVSLAYSNVISDPFANFLLTGSLRDAAVRLAGPFSQPDCNELLLVLLGCHPTVDTSHHEYRAVVGGVAWQADAVSKLARKG
jgi:hypothetical protein